MRELSDSLRDKKENLFLPASPPFPMQTTEFVSRLMVRRLRRHGLTFQKIPPKDVAVQLTSIFTSVITHIQPCELVRQAWDKNTRDSEAPNVSALQELLYRMRPLASLAAVLEHVADRKAYVLYMVEVLQHLKSWNDFNGIVLIFGGLTNSSVHRLSLWPDIEEEFAEEFDQLRKIMDPHRNSKDLRAAMEAASPPCLPYVNVFLRDLIFTNDGNASYKSSPENSPASSPEIGSEMINRRKAELATKIIKNVQRLVDKAKYTLPQQADLQHLLLSCPLLTGGQLDLASRWNEPQSRGRPEEKPTYLVPALENTYELVKPRPKRYKNTAVSMPKLIVIILAIIVSIVFRLCK